MFLSTSCWFLGISAIVYLFLKNDFIKPGFADCICVFAYLGSHFFSIQLVNTILKQNVILSRHTAEPYLIYHDQIGE